MPKISIGIMGYWTKIWVGITGLENPMATLLKGVGPREKAGRLLHMFFKQLFIHTNLINAEAISELYEKLVTATLFNKVSLHRNHWHHWHHCLQYICLFNKLNLVPLRCTFIFIEPNKCIFIRGRPFDYWGGGGGWYGWFQKKYSCRLFSYTEKQNNLLWLFILEKTSYTVVCRGKNF